MFLDEILALPLNRDIDFTIEEVPKATPVSKAPYRMRIIELVELKIQLHERMDKKYIRPGMSPWGAPMLFVKKNVGTLRL